MTSRHRTRLAPLYVRDRANVMAVTLIAIVTDALREWLRDNEPIDRAEVVGRVAARLRDDYTKLEQQLRAGGRWRPRAATSSTRQSFLALKSCPAAKLLIQEISAAQDRREVAALLASFDLTQVPRQCLGAFQRHITDRLNELSD